MTYNRQSGKTDKRQDNSMRNRIAAAFAGITAGMIALWTATTPAAQASPSTVADCQLVTRADADLCHQVQLQHAYGSYTSGHAHWTVPGGKAIVHDITHQGLSKREMHYALRAAAEEYRQYVTAVPVNMDAMVRECGNTDGRWVVSYKDEDGRPGGVKLTRKRIDCA